MREREDLLQLFIEHAPVALAMLDRQMRYVAVSRKWLEIHDLHGRDLIGQSHYEIFPDIPEGMEGRASTALWRAKRYWRPNIACREKTAARNGWTGKFGPGSPGTARWAGSLSFPRTSLSTSGRILRCARARRCFKRPRDIAGLGSYALDIDLEVWTSSEVMDEIFGIDKKFERSVKGWAAWSIPKINHRRLPISKMKCWARASLLTGSIG